MEQSLSMWLRESGMPQGVRRAPALMYKTGVIAVRLTAFTKGKQRRGGQSICIRGRAESGQKPGICKKILRSSVRLLEGQKSFIEQNPSLNLQSIDAILEEAGLLWPRALWQPRRCWIPWPLDWTLRWR